jgi:hypothetical protein
MNSQSGRDAENIKSGSILSNDQLADKCLNAIFTNSRTGKVWKKDEDSVEREAELG